MQSADHRQLSLFKPYLDSQVLYLTFSSYKDKKGNGNPYLGIRVAPCAGNIKSVGVATFRIGTEIYASNLEWYGPYYGFTAKTVEELPEEKKAPKSLGKAVLKRLRKVGRQYFALKAIIQPVIVHIHLWKSQLKKTVSFIQRNTDLLQSPLPSGVKSSKIKSGGVVKNCSIDLEDCSSPGFSLVKGASGRVYMRLGIVIYNTYTKKYQLDLDVFSQKLCVRKKGCKDSTSPQGWAAEMEFSRILKQAEAEGVDLTGLLVPLDIQDNEIIVPRGKDIVELLNNKGLSSGEKAKIAYEIAKGISTMHGLGYVHRDIKPDNILKLEDGSYRLIDFEFSKTSKDFNNGLESSGTRGYEPPEYRNPQQQGVDARKIDSWMFGILLYMLYVGVQPDFFDQLHEDNFISLIESSKKDLGMRNMPQPIRELLLELFEISWQKRMHVTQACEHLEQVLFGER